MRAKCIVIETISFLLILLFTYTALSKLSNYSFFKSQLSLYPVLNHFTGFISLALPVTELAIVILLPVPATRLYGLYASILLLILFTLYLVIMLLSQSNLPCSCGGVIEKLSWSEHIVFNAVFIVFALVAVRLEGQKKREPNLYCNKQEKPNTCTKK